MTEAHLSDNPTEDVVDTPPAPTPVPKPPKVKLENNTPQVPAVEEKSAAVPPAAVGTTFKYGWQQPAVRALLDPEPCFHMGIVQARKQIVEHELGHEWVCSCGDVFEVVLNLADKKVLLEKGA